jgi:hypothetical protein
MITYGTEKPIRIHCFVLKDDDSHDNIFGNDGDILSVACQTVLPSLRFENDWNSLAYDSGEDNIT